MLHRAAAYAPSGLRAHRSAAPLTLAAQQMMAVTADISPAGLGTIILRREQQLNALGAGASRLCAATAFVLDALHMNNDTSSAAASTSPPILLLPSIPEHVELLQKTLIKWQDASSGVHAVLLASDAARAFCAGGDVKAARSAVLEAPYSGVPPAGHKVHKIFTSEYSTLLSITRSRPPVVALCQGIVMGLGAGLASCATARVVTDDTVWAMPETHIGAFWFITGSIVGVWVGGGWEWGQGGPNGDTDDAQQLGWLAGC